MWIERIDIELFQAMKQQSIGPLGPGMVVFLGMNGAGKTTVMEFIRWVLYGDGSLQRGERYAKKLGSITLFDEHNQKYSIVRDQKNGRQAGSISLNDKTASQQDVDELLARIDRDTFRQVFAIGLEELRQSADIKKVQDSLASALQGTGATSLPDAITQFELEAKRYAHRNGNSVTEASKQAKCASEADAEIKKLQNDQDSYDSLQAELAGLQVSNLHIKSELETQRQELAESKRLAGAWSDWCELQLAQKNLEQQADLLLLPLTRREEYNQLKQTIIGLQQQADERQAEIASKRRQLDQVEGSINQPLIQQQQAVTDVCRRVKQADGPLRGISDLSRSCEQLQRDIEEELMRLGNCWDIERLRQSRINATLQARLSTSDAELIQARLQHDQLLAEQRKLDIDISNKQQEIDDRRKALAEFEGLPSSEQLSERKAQLSSLSEQIQNRHAVQLQIASIPQIPPANSSPMWVQLVIGVMLVLVGGWLVVTGQQVVGLLLVVVGIGLVGIALWTRPKAPAVSPASAPLDDTLKKLQCGIEQICQQLGITEADRSSYMQSIETQLLRVGEWVSLQRAVHALEDDLTRLQRAQDKLALPDASTRLHTAQADWNRLMIEIGLPEGLSLEAAHNLLDRVMGAQASLSSLEQKREQLVQSTTLLNELDAQLLPLQALIDTDPNAAIWDRSTELNDCLAQCLNADQLRVGYESELLRLSQSEQLLFRKIEFARHQMAEILQAFGAEDDTQLADICVQAEEARELDNRIKQLDSVLIALSGPGEAREKFDQRLREIGDISDLNLRIQQLQQQIAEYERLTSEQFTRCGQLQEQINRLETDTALAEQLVIREQAKQELQQSLLKWLRPWLANKLLCDIQASYVNDHQEPVLKTASELITQITDGRIMQLKTEPEGKDKIEFLAVPSDGTEPLKPSQWNQALREQAYFAIRLGYMLDRFEKRSPVPVVLDDILANCDPYHQQRLADVITEIAQREGHQLLFFTCHPETAALFPQSQRGDIKSLQVALG